MALLKPVILGHLHKVAGIVRYHRKYLIEWGKSLFFTVSRNSRITVKSNKLEQNGRKHEVSLHSHKHM